MYSKGIVGQKGRERFWELEKKEDAKIPLFSDNNF